MKQEKNLKWRMMYQFAAFALMLIAFSTTSKAQVSTPTAATNETVNKTYAPQTAANAQTTAINEQANDTVKQAKDADDVEINPETMPSFPGGTAAILEHLRKNMRYPAYCREHGIKGRVLVQFIVDVDGSISDIAVVNSVHELLDKEAMRVISIMPNWNPGTQRGKPVRVKYTIPVNFRLN